MSPMRAGRGLFGGLVAALVCVLAFAVAPAHGAVSYPPLTGRVVDDAHVLDAATVSDLTQKLAALEASTGHQLVVATVASLQDQPIEDYGVGLLRAWGIGRKANNDGAILIVAPTERKLRVEVGYGLEGVLTDALSRRIIERSIVPKFRAGDLSGGVADGTQALIDQLKAPDGEAKANVAQASDEQAQAQARAQAEAPRRHRSGGIFGLIFPILFVLFMLGNLFGRNRRYGGGGGGMGWLLPMIMLGGLGRGGRDDDWGGGGGFGGGGGGFSGGGGSGGGGGASGGW